MTRRLNSVVLSVLFDNQEEEVAMQKAMVNSLVPFAEELDFAEEKEVVEEKGADVIDEEQESEGEEEDLDQVPIDNLTLSPTTTVGDIIDTWDYATALDVEETVPFSRVVCVPPLFRKSVVSRSLSILHMTVSQ